MSRKDPGKQTFVSSEISEGVTRLDVFEIVGYKGEYKSTLFPFCGADHVNFTTRFWLFCTVIAI